MAINSVQTRAGSVRVDWPQNQETRAFCILRRVPYKLDALTENQGVGGSIPPLGTIRIKRPLFWAARRVCGSLPLPPLDRGQGIGRQGGRFAQRGLGRLALTAGLDQGPCARASRGFLTQRRLFPRGHSRGRAEGLGAARRMIPVSTTPGVGPALVRFNLSQRFRSEVNSANHRRIHCRYSATHTLCLSSQLFD